MGDVLSQSEIDNLLAALSSGELDADEMKETANDKVVKNYDFNRPSKFSKEHLRTLEIIFEHYSRLLSTSLPVYLRKNVQVEVINSEAQIYSEFTNALSNPVLLGIIDFAPLEGNIIIEIADNIGYAIIDRMLGGNGNPLERYLTYLWRKCHHHGHQPGPQCDEVRAAAGAGSKGQQDYEPCRRPCAH